MKRFISIALIVWLATVYFTPKPVTEHGQWFYISPLGDIVITPYHTILAPKAKIPPPLPKKTLYYFTSFNLVVSQTDNDPCHWATPRVNLCELRDKWVNIIAIAKDIRTMMWIKWGDKVLLTWDKGCAGVASVYDEMGARFRNSCIYRPWTKICIKWDIVDRPGGACTITKLNHG